MIAVYLTCPVNHPPRILEAAKCYFNKPLPSDLKWGCLVHCS